MKKIQIRITQLFMVISALGFVDALFLTEKHYSSSSFVCPIFDGCDVVTTSSYSTIFGIPIAVFGLMYYATIFLLSFWSYMTSKKRGSLLASQLSITGFLMSIVLIYLMIFVIQAICFYCLLSAFVSTGIFLLGVVFLKYEEKYLLKTFYLYIRSIRTEKNSQ